MIQAIRITILQPSKSYHDTDDSENNLSTKVRCYMHDQYNRPMNSNRVAEGGWLGKDWLLFLEAA